MNNTYLLSVLIVLTACSDVVTSDYDTLKQAKQDRLFERGWLPNILPVSTRSITVSSDLDLNTATGHFKISVNDLQVFKQQLEPTEYVNQLVYIENGNQWTFTVSNDGAIEYTLRRVEF
ncbi:hypothetical protein ACPV4B_03405 [Vibrio parahaemolyticus]